MSLEFLHGTSSKKMEVNPVCLKDFEEYARKYATKSFFDFWASGANAEQTVQENIMAFKRLRLRPRVLRNVSNIDISTTILGQQVSSPIALGPSSLHKLAHPDGETATARAAASFDLCCIISCGSSVSWEEVASCTPKSLKWAQLYILSDREETKHLVLKAEKTGNKALVVTVDLPVLGIRLQDKRNKLTIPEDKSYAMLKGPEISNGTDGSSIAKYCNSHFDSSFTWKDLDWLSSITSLPVILKGILAAEDANIALSYPCVKGILVSNHGGRQLDGVPATIEALPEIVKAVNGKVEVYLDGGVRQGTDVLKALALGARAVFIGRPVLWGLAYDGEEGLEKLLSILHEEFKTSMALSGCASLSDVGPELVVNESYYKKSSL